MIIWPNKVESYEFKQKEATVSYERYDRGLYDSENTNRGKALDSTSIIMHNEDGSFKSSAVYSVIKDKDNNPQLFVRIVDGTNSFSTGESKPGFIVPEKFVSGQDLSPEQKEAYENYSSILTQALPKLLEENPENPTFQYLKERFYTPTQDSENTILPEE